MAMRLSARTFEDVKSLVADFTGRISLSGFEIMDQVNDYFSTDYYEQVFKLTESFADSFNGSFKSKISTWLDEWQEGDTSFVYLAESIKAGEETVEEARQQQQLLVEAFKEIHFPTNIDSGNKISEINTERISLLASSITEKAEQVSDDLTAFEGKLEDILSENQFYTGISHVIVPANKVYSELLKDFGKSVAILAEKTLEAGELERSRMEGQIEESKITVSQQTREISEEILEQMNTLFDGNDL
ncbi:hypothetical protein [Carnobacterium sp. TMP28]|uniref:hypothetical protein n=1 Tax=Carnobacterium sp. TMP28 TaxID=3397060 RepID=UPI0039E1742E